MGIIFHYVPIGHALGRRRRHRHHHHHHHHHHQSNNSQLYFITFITVA
jgi:hypothetical protein